MTKDIFESKVALAILAGATHLEIKYQSLLDPDGKPKTRKILLPTAQKAGTHTQNYAYALQKAEDIAAENFIPPIISITFNES